MREVRIIDTSLLQGFNDIVGKSMLDGNQVFGIGKEYRLKIREVVKVEEDGTMFVRVGNKQRRILDIDRLVCAVTLRLGGKQPDTFQAWVKVCFL